MAKRIHEERQESENLERWLDMRLERLSQDFSNRIECSQIMDQRAQVYERKKVFSENLEVFIALINRISLSRHDFEVSGQNWNGKFMVSYLNKIKLLSSIWD